MDNLKEAVFVGCMLGIGFAVLKGIIPDKKLFKNVKTIMSLIFLTSVIMPFLKQDFSFSIETFSAQSVDNSEVLQQALDDAYRNEIEKTLEKNLSLFLKSKEIQTDKLVIETYVDEYNYLEIKKVRLYVSYDNRSKTEKIIKEQLGENILVEFYD